MDEIVQESQSSKADPIVVSPTAQWTQAVDDPIEPVSPASEGFQVWCWWLCDPCTIARPWWKLAWCFPLFGTSWWTVFEVCVCHLLRTPSNCGLLDTSIFALLIVSRFLTHKQSCGLMMKSGFTFLHCNSVTRNTMLSLPMSIRGCVCWTHWLLRHGFKPRALIVRFVVVITLRFSTRVFPSSLWYWLTNIGFQFSWTRWKRFCRFKHGMLPLWDNGDLDQVIHKLAESLGFADTLIQHEHRMFFTSHLCGALAIAFLRGVLIGTMLPGTSDEASLVHTKLRAIFADELKRCQITRRPWVWGAGDWIGPAWSTQASKSGCRLASHVIKGLTSLIHEVLNWETMRFGFTFWIFSRTSLLRTFLRFHRSLPLWSRWCTVVGNQ